MDDYPVIVGMACRVPGANSPAKLWENINAKRDLRRKFPKERFNVDAFYHPNYGNKGTTNAKYGYVLDDPVDLFDAEFFGISGKEAEAIDPQQRLLLEVVYEALEDAQITMEEISGSNTSVFCGSLGNDYSHFVAADLEHYPRHSITGQGNALLANRVSYFYDLRGPSLQLDTACSSSLVCLHLGSNSIKTGESDIAVIGGCSLILTPGFSVLGSDMGFFSSSGRCQSFDAASSGYGRGEGICAIILKRKSLAIRDGNITRAIVRSTAVNHDGKKTGITVPSSKSQEAMIRAAYFGSGLDPDDTQYFEAHGTGTRVGDPSEAQAIGAVFATPTRTQPLYLGSVKSNIGHLEGSAGLAGVIKTVMALEKRKIPPNMLFVQPNPDIKFDEWKLHVPTTEVDWPTPPNGIYRASCNSFGYGGANAHVVLESYGNNSGQATATLGNGILTNGDYGAVPDRPFLLPITSHNQDAGNLAVDALLNYIRTKHAEELEVKDLAYSLCFKRSMHRVRSFAVGHDRDSVCMGLERIREISPSSWMSATAQGVPRLGFVFTGQGAQSFDMGRQLLHMSPLFRSTLERFDRVLGLLPDSPKWTVIQELMRPEADSKLDEATFSQPICTALQLALVDLLQRWGIHPTTVCGHSSGEIAAAYAAGILPFETAAVVAYYRGLHMGHQNHERVAGGMMAVGMSEMEAAAELVPFSGRLVLACVNSPSSVTISGDIDDLNELESIISARGTFCRFLKVKQAFHSHHMLPLAAPYREALEASGQLRATHGSARMFSSVTSRIAKPGHMGAAYWAENMLRPVRYADALTGSLLDEDENRLVDILVEIGPHPTLRGPSRQVVSSLRLGDIPYLATLERGRPAYVSLLETAGQLFSRGLNVDLVAVNQDQYLNDKNLITHHSRAKRLRDLPSYSWNHKAYWAGTRRTRDITQRKFFHSILGSILPGEPENSVTWRNFLRLNELPWLRGHMLDDSVVFPGSGYVCLAVEGAVRMRGIAAEDVESICIRDLDIRSALTLNESEQGTEVLVQMRPMTASAKTSSEDWLEFTVSSYNQDEQFSEHCHGLVAVKRGIPGPLEPIHNHNRPEKLLADSHGRIPCFAFYSHMHKIGLQYNEHFRLLDGHINLGKGFSVGGLHFTPGHYSPPELGEHTILHPALLDAAFHMVWLSAHSRLGVDSTDLFVPRFLKSMEISGLLVNPGFYGCGEKQRFVVSSTSERPTARTIVSTDIIWSADGSQMLVEARDMESTALELEKGSEAERPLFFQQLWKPCFDFLSPETKVEESADVFNLVELFVFQHPSAKILVMSSANINLHRLVRSLRPGSTRGLLCQSFHLYLPEADEACRRDISAKHGVSVCSPDGCYDLVIVAGYGGTNVEDALPAEHWGDRITLITDTDPANLGLSANMNSTISQVGSAFVSRHRQAPCTTRRLAGLTIVLHSMKPSEQTNRIEEQLKIGIGASSVTTTCLSLPTFEDDLEVSSDIVVLVGLDGDIGTAQDWICMRHLLGLENKNMVIMVAGGMMECSDPVQAKMVGLIKTARNENPLSRIVTLDIERTTSPEQTAKRLLQALDTELVEEELAERDGCVFIARVGEDEPRNAVLPNNPGHVSSYASIAGDVPMRMTIGNIGLLESICFEPNDDMIRRPLGDDEIDIKVMASAMNFRDVAIAMGLVQDWGLGSECAGFIVATGPKASQAGFKIGDRVQALRIGAHCTVLRAPAAVCRRIPDDMTFTAASSYINVLTTALYALFDIGRLQAGETVLIHSGAGGVGQVAIQLARRVGATVFATCSAPKREFLKTKFDLDDAHIFSSRDDSFVRGVLQATGGRGVDVVLNSLSGKLLLKTWDCVAHFGRFVEIGKRDIHQNAMLPMESFRKNTVFAAVDMVLVLQHTPHLATRLLDEAAALVFNGHIRLPETLLEVPFADAEKAFRLLQLGRHVGKIILVPDGNDIARIAPPSYRDSITPLFDPAKMYLLVGGLGGLGSAVAEWMYLMGASRFAFLSRSGSRKTGGDTLDWLRSKNATVRVYTGDVTNLTEVEAVVTDMEKHGILGGIMHAAAVLQDSSLRTMTFSQWETCVKVKCDGAWNLHTAALNRHLDFFLCFSSISTIVGNPGQANYNAANAYLDGLMQWRRGRGLVGTSINIAAVSGVGIFADLAESAQHAASRHQLETIDLPELMFLIQEALVMDRAFLRSNLQLRPLEKSTKYLISGLSLKNINGPLASRALFRNLYASRQDSDAQTGGAKRLARLLSDATDPEERTAILKDYFIQKVAAVLDVPVNSIIPNSSLSSYGLDSIVAVELRRWFKESARIDIPLFEFLSAQSIDSLVTKALDTLPDAAAAAKSDQVSQRPGDASIGGGPNTAVSPAGADLPKTQSIPKARGSDLVPISAFQSRMYDFHRLYEEKWRLNLVVVTKFQVTSRGSKSLEGLLRESLVHLVHHHPILATAYVDHGGFVEQRVLGELPADFELPLHDLSNVKNPELALEALVMAQKRRPLRIEQGEVFGGTGVYLGDQVQALVMSYHHIAVDDRSLDIVTNCWRDIFRALGNERDPSEAVTSPRITHADFTLWHTALLRSDAIRPHRDFWRSYLAGAPTTSSLLPFARRSDRPATFSVDKARHEQRVPASLVRRMRRVCARAGITPFHFVLAAVRVVLFRATHESDIVLCMLDGMARPHADTNGLVGFFTNAVPLRMFPSVASCNSHDLDHTIFIDIARAASNTVLQAMAHNIVPYSEIISLTNRPSAKPGVAPLSQIAINYMKRESMPLVQDTSDVKVLDIDIYNVSIGWDFSVEFIESTNLEHGELTVSIEHSLALYGADDMKVFLGDLVSFLESVIRDHNQEVG